MPVWAWLVIFALEAAIVVVYFRDEIRLRAFQRRYALRPEGRGFHGTVAGRTAALPNLRNVDEDPELRIHVPVAIGRLRQVGSAGNGFDATFELDASPDIRWGVWTEDAERQALELARFGTLASLGPSEAGRAALSLKVPRPARFRDGPAALEGLAALANHLTARESQLEHLLRIDLALPHPRGISAIEALLHRGWATESEVEAVLVPLLRGDDRTLCERAARIVDRHDVPTAVVEALANRAPIEGVWSAPSFMEGVGSSSWAGCVARAVVRLGRLTEAEAMRWLDGPAPVVDVALDHLAATGGVVAYQAVRASLERAMTKELRNHTHAALAQLRERHPTLGEGQLAFSAPEGGELAEVAGAGTIALAEEKM